jgi:magnesium-transporting ATPase (P-type)
VKESVKAILELKKEHTEVLVKTRFSDCYFPSLTSSVNPSILKLTEEEDKAGMALLGPFFSNPPPLSRYLFVFLLILFIFILILFLSLFLTLYYIYMNKSKFLTFFFFLTNFNYRAKQSLT